MPFDDTLKWTTTGSGFFLALNVLVKPSRTDSDPVNDSMSTLSMYNTLHAGKEKENNECEYV